MVGKPAGKKKRWVIPAAKTRPEAVGEAPEVLAEVPEAAPGTGGARVLTSVARGRLAEEAAADFLRRQGFRVLARNYRTPLGEIDLVARDGEQVVMVEVKARSGTGYGSALEAVGPLKERRLRGAAAWWMAEHGHAPRGIRFDVITVHLGPGGSLRSLHHLSDVLGGGR